MKCPECGNQAFTTETTVHVFTTVDMGEPEQASFSIAWESESDPLKIWCAACEWSPEEDSEEHKHIEKVMEEATEWTEEM